MMRIFWVMIWMCGGVWLCGCTRYFEDRASAGFAPIYPSLSFAEETRQKTGAIYQIGQDGLFSTDRRARKIGDILTIDFNETFAATKAQSTASAKTDAFDLTLPSALPNILTGGLGQGKNALNSGTRQSFSGSGKAAQSNSLTGRVSVTVMQILGNENMRVLGQKELTLNNGKEYIRVSGVVRPEDISSENIVPSNRLADAQISYIGAGEIADSSKQGWLSRALRAISPF